MNDRLLRIGAVAAVAGAVAQLVASLLEPDWSGPPAQAIRVVAKNAFWDGDRLLDLIGVFLTVTALTIASRLLAKGPGREWASLGQPFLVLMGALGASAVATGHGMKVLADGWASAPPNARSSYLAAFDATSEITDALFFAAFLALGLFLVTLSTAILAGRVYARWIGWASAASATLLLSGDLLSIESDAAFAAVLAGFLLFLVVLVALGVSIRRRPAAVHHLDARGAAAREPKAALVTTEGP